MRRQIFNLQSMILVAQHRHLFRWKSTQCYFTCVKLLKTKTVRLHAQRHEDLDLVLVDDDVEHVHTMH